MKILTLSSLLLTLLLFSPHFTHARHNACKPSGKVRGIKKPPPDYCNEEDPICCIKGRYYTTYKCSPSVSKTTKGILNLRGFSQRDDYFPAKCDERFYSDDTPVVSMSTGWFNEGSRCLKNVTISAKGRSVEAMVVDECDSSMGCDKDHDFLPPCGNNILAASEAVWKGLGVPLEEWGELDITWTDA